MKKRILISMALVAMVSGCSQYSVRQMTDADGKPIGLTWHGFRQTGDFASWQHTSVITEGKTVRNFATDRGAGFVDPMMGAAGMVGAGYFIGGGLRKAEGDLTTQNQFQGQHQKQHQNLNWTSGE